MFKFAKKSARNWTHIIIHHSESTDNGLHNWDEIEHWHIDEQGWSQIGYNFGIERNDRGEYIYCIGRGLDCVGAHTKGMNETAVGIVVVGNFDNTSPIDSQYWMLAQLCKDLMRDFNIPIENIQRHSEYADKTCPGKMFDMSILKDKILNNGFKPPYNG